VVGEGLGSSGHGKVSTDIDTWFMAEYIYGGVGVYTTAKVYCVMLDHFVGALAVTRAWCFL
jgi:hypothetical protein